MKKTLATSVSISFAGLIRAHGEVGGGTTTWNADNTTATTTDSGGTTTWNADDATIPVSVQSTDGPYGWEDETVKDDPETTAGINSIQIQEPDHQKSGGNWTIGGDRITKLKSRTGFVGAVAGGNKVQGVEPWWTVTIRETGPRCSADQFVTNDCLYYSVSVTIVFHLIPPGVPFAGQAFQDQVSAVAKRVLSIISPPRFRTLFLNPD